MRTYSDPDDGTVRASLARRERQLRTPDGTLLRALRPELAALADRQCGTATRRQLAACGITRAQRDAALEARRWQAFGRNVIVLHNAALLPRQRLWVGVLLPGKPAALAGLSATAAMGMCGFDPSHVHVLVAHATESQVPSWVRVHESRRFDPASTRRAQGLPCLPAARSTIDAAAWSRFPRRACSILAAAVQQRLASADMLADELRRAGRVRHAAVMRAVLGDIAGGGHTLAEIELGPLARRAGLPPPGRQRFRRDSTGKVRWLDAEIDLPDGTVLVVEINGAAHMQTDEWTSDLDRQNEIVIGKNPILRFPSIVIRLESHRVVDQLQRIRLAYTP